MHTAKRIGHGQYEYRGFRIDNSFSARWQIMLGDVHGWLAAANTLRQAKGRIDQWYEAAASGRKIDPQYLAAVESITRAACAAGDPVACPDQHTCRHGIED